MTATDQTPWDFCNTLRELLELPFLPQKRDHSDMSDPYSWAYVGRGLSIEMIVIFDKEERLWYAVSSVIGGKVTVHAYTVQKVAEKFLSRMAEHLEFQASEYRQKHAALLEKSQLTK